MQLRGQSQTQLLPGHPSGDWSLADMVHCGWIDWTFEGRAIGRHTNRILLKWVDQTSAFCVDFWRG